MDMVMMKCLSEEAESAIYAMRFVDPCISMEGDAQRRGHADTPVCFLLRKLKDAEKRISATIAAAEIHRARSRGGRHGRPHSMTPERAAVATRMLKAGQAGQIVWKTLAAMQGPPIGRSAYYLWLKYHHPNLERK
ncbi:hypothetical protein [Paenirhodobacter sp.]|uniref:hypothetical protein n=1 Tax=Paenirhodobacter sp. TaxID=1965326 RepID=UPI003B3E4E2E